MDTWIVSTVVKTACYDGYGSIAFCVFCHFLESIVQLFRCRLDDTLIQQLGQVSALTTLLQLRPFLFLKIVAFIKYVKSSDEFKMTKFNQNHAEYLETSKPDDGDLLKA